MAEWPLAYMLPSLSPDEVLSSIGIRYWQEPHGYAFAEFARRHGDFAIVSVGCLLAVEGGKVTRAAIAVGGAQETPYRLTASEEALIGQPPSADVFKEASAIARSQDAMSDAYVSSAYRQRLTGVLTERALATAASRAGN
jgi:carbon-monoxide dehydrogenase medium subunit